MSFDSLGLDPKLLQAVEKAGYTQPSPIQAQAIPAINAQHDVLAAAQTGTGKTAAFTLPILQKLTQEQPVSGRKVKSLILTPTRELAAQVHEAVIEYSQFMKPRPKTAVVFGGVKINPQIERLSQGADVLVACPGRLLDLVNQKAIFLDQVNTLVLDEADRMLDMGFLRDIKRILALLPKKRQNLLFSATFSSEIRALTNTILVDPVSIDVAPRNTTAKAIDQSIYKTEKGAKSALLIHLIKQHQLKQVLVFTVTKHMANRVTQRLERAGISAAAIHGNKSQNARTSALAGFKDGSVNVLVATDVAARGIDISELPNVINFELPKAAPDYVHRIGRTGRAGASGQAMSLVSPEEQGQLKQIERLINKKLPVAVAENFDPAAQPAMESAPSPSRDHRQQGGASQHRQAQGQGNRRRKPRRSNSSTHSDNTHHNRDNERKHGSAHRSGASGRSTASKDRVRASNNERPARGNTGGKSPKASNQRHRQQD